MGSETGAHAPALAAFHALTEFVRIRRAGRANLGAGLRAAGGVLPQRRDGESAKHDDGSEDRVSHVSASPGCARLIGLAGNTKQSAPGVSLTQRPLVARRPDPHKGVINAERWDIAQER